MAADVALSRETMALYPFCRLSGPANVLVMPAAHSASISTKMLQQLGGVMVVGPLLTGLEQAGADRLDERHRIRYRQPGGDRRIRHQWLIERNPRAQSRSRRRAAGKAGDRLVKVGAVKRLGEKSIHARGLA